MDKIKHIKYKTLALDLTKESVIRSLFREGQIMPLFLYLKKTILDKTPKGDGIIGYEDQGVNEKGNKYKFDMSEPINSSHDIPTSKEAMTKIAKMLTDESEPKSVTDGNER